LSLGNLFVGRQSFAWTRGRHAFKFGGEFRANRDTTYFGAKSQRPICVRRWGGRFATSAIRSASGDHDISADSSLPDTLSGFLSGSAFSYTVAVAPPQFPQGNQIGVAAISRYNLNLYAEDSWEDFAAAACGLRLAVRAVLAITERARRTAGMGSSTDR